MLKMEVEVVSELEPALKSTLLGDEVFVVNPVRFGAVDGLGCEGAGWSVPPCVCVCVCVCVRGLSRAPVILFGAPASRRIPVGCRV